MCMQWMLCARDGWMAVQLHWLHSTYNTWWFGWWTLLVLICFRLCVRTFLVMEARAMKTAHSDGLSHGAATERGRSTRGAPGRSPRRPLPQPSGGAAPGPALSTLRSTKHSPQTQLHVLGYVSYRNTDRFYFRRLGTVSTCTCNSTDSSRRTVGLCECAKIIKKKKKIVQNQFWEALGREVPSSKDRAAAKIRAIVKMRFSLTTRGKSKNLIITSGDSELSRKI